MLDDPLVPLYIRTSMPSRGVPPVGKHDDNIVYTFQRGVGRSLQYLPKKQDSWQFVARDDEARMEMTRAKFEKTWK